MAATRFVMWVLLQGICAKAARIEDSLMEDDYDDDYDDDDDHHSSTGSIMYEDRQPQEPDDSYLSELALLAGDASDDVSLTEAALEELGWTRGVLVADTTHQSVGMMDHARTFSKNGRCVATFGATNDAVDTQQVLGGLTVDPINFCGFQMHAGVVDEMNGFMRAPNWNDFIDVLELPQLHIRDRCGAFLGGCSGHNVRRLRQQSRGK